jgi:CHAD domain-containing protein
MPQHATTDRRARNLGSRSAKRLTQPIVPKSTEVKPDDPAGLAVALAVRQALARIKSHEPEAKRGEREGVHRLRSACRRLRGELGALHELVQNVWRERLEGELKWLARLFGKVRDLDILNARLLESAGKLDGHKGARETLGPVLATLEARRTEAAREVALCLESTRFAALVEMLEQGALRPQLEEKASLACRDVLPLGARDGWRRLKKAARGLRKNDPAEEFHEARKRAKGARYAAELIAPLLGHRAARAAGEFIRLTTRVQDSLGEHQDALITVDELEAALTEHAEDRALVANVSDMLEDQRSRASAARARFFKIWSKLDRKKLRRWMRPRGQGERSALVGGAAVRENGYHS